MVYPTCPVAFSPSPHPRLQFLRSVLGYAARRGSEAGPALDVGERRKLSHSGPAENGLPPKTAKRQLFGFRFGRACAAHMVSVRIGTRVQRKSQRDRSCGHKPPNGALKGVTYYISLRGSFQRPVRTLTIEITKGGVHLEMRKSHNCGRRQVIYSLLHCGINAA